MIIYLRGADRAQGTFLLVIVHCQREQTVEGNIFVGSAIILMAESDYFR